MRAFRYLLRSLFAVIAILGVASAGAQAMDLIMFELPSCGTCKVFKREVLPIYAASPAGKVFPLWVVEMGGKAVVPDQSNRLRLHQLLFGWITASKWDDFPVTSARRNSSAS